MPMSAPDVETAPASFKAVTLRFIDASGDQRAISGKFAVAVTNAQIQAWAEAEGAASNANLWEVQVNSVWSSGAALKSLADDEVYPSVYDNLVIAYAGSLGHSERTFIPAPIQGMFVTGSDVPDLTDGALLDVVNAYNVLADGGTEDFVPKSARFTERKEKNEAEKF